MNSRTTDPREWPRADAPSFVDLLPHLRVDPEGSVVLLADSSDAQPRWMGVAWKLVAPETEAASEGEIGLLASRVDALLTTLPQGAVAQFLLRARRDISQKLTAWNGAARDASDLLVDLTHSRSRALESLDFTYKGRPFRARSLEVHFTVALKGTWPDLRVTFRTAAGAIEDRLRQGYVKERRRVLDLAATIENLLTASNIGFARLDEDGFLRLLHRVLNPSFPQGGGSSRELLRDRAAATHLSADLDSGIVALDGVMHKIVSVAGLPASTWAGMLGAVVDMVPELDVVLNIDVPDQEQARRRFTGVRKDATNQSQDAHQSPTLAPLLEEFVSMEMELAGGARILSTRIHAILSGRDEEELDGWVRSARNALHQAGFRTVLEDALAPTLFLQCLPLAYRPENDRALRRGRKALTQNVGHLVPLYGAMKGTVQPGQILVNRSGEPVFLNFFSSQLAPHAIVSGQPGSGKSVFANDLILNARRCGARVVVLDRGGSYERLCGTLGGAYVALDVKRPRRINPCGRSDANGNCPEEVNAFLRDWLVEIATQGKDDLSVHDRSVLSIAVRKAFAAKPQAEIFLSDIEAALRSLAAETPVAKELAVCLSDFAGRGPYARLFDGPNEIDFANPFVAIDLAGAALEDAVASVLVMAIMHYIADSARQWPHAEKYLVIDEAWTLLRSAASARFIVNVSRTARKNRMSLVVVSQQITDFEGPTGQAIVNQAPYKVFLRQNAQAISAAQSFLGLTPREVELYQSVDTVKGRFSEMLVKTPESTGVARLVPDPFTYWLTTTDPKDKVLLERLIEKHRGTVQPALREAALKYPFGVGAIEEP
ncbi:MAG: TraC family protein [Planctomycetes bacterium]|nr:TraC family protein [Planctomycetota bacterium]